MMQNMIKDEEWEHSREREMTQPRGQKYFENIVVSEERGEGVKN